jgi:5'-methylthioadenosine phosphorylase
VKLGIIGGSGLYQLPGLDVEGRVEVDTPWGPPSDALVVGKLGGVDLVFLPRHGSGHVHPPTRLPYRANIHALKQAGVTHLLSVNAVGSLQEPYPPRTLLIPDQIIDRTVHREPSFFDDGIVAHVGIADPFCDTFSDALEAAAGSAGEPVVRGGTYICIEGPQFSTKAESRLYRSWGASVIGMTAMPEARLAREAELCYAALTLVTDYDVWHDTEGPVSVEKVVEHLHHNVEAAKRVIVALAQAGLPDRACACETALASAIVTDPRRVTPEIRERLRVIAGRYLDVGNAG